MHANSAQMVTYKDAPWKLKNSSDAASKFPNVMNALAP